MSIHDLKRQQQANLRFRTELKPLYEQALADLYDKVIIFHEKALPEIFDTVESKFPKLEFYQDIGSRSPKCPTIISARLSVPGTKFQVGISNQPYGEQKPRQYGRTLLIEFGLYIDGDFILGYETALDAGALPFILGLKDRASYRFVWRGMKDNAKVVDAIVHGLHTNRLPPSEFSGFYKPRSAYFAFIADLMGPWRRRNQTY
jgi:hypothetical protein